MRTVKKCSILTVLAVVLLVPTVHGKDTINYQNITDNARWRWSEALTDPLVCIQECRGNYDLRIVSSNKDDKFSLTLTIMSGGKDLYTWQGHEKSVFTIFEDRLYIAIFSQHAAAGRIVAVNLRTGKKLWDSSLKAMEVIFHSGYNTLLNLDCNHDVVIIYGNESRGRYIEIKRTDTGETVGHKMFPNEASNKDLKGSAEAIP